METSSPKDHFNKEEEFSIDLEASSEENTNMNDHKETTQKTEDKRKDYTKPISVRLGKSNIIRDPNHPSLQKGEKLDLGLMPPDHPRRRSLKLKASLKAIARLLKTDFNSLTSEQMMSLLIVIQYISLGSHINPVYRYERTFEGEYLESYLGIYDLQLMELFKRFDIYSIIPDKK